MSNTQEPKTVPCPRCTHGTVAGTNGQRWRCAYCQGTGAVVKETA